LAQLGEPRLPGIGDDDAENPPVGGIGSTFDETLFGQLVEVADERRWLDAHELGELALAGVVGVRGLVAEKAVPEAGPVLVQATVELVVDGAVGQVQHSSDGLFHSALIISTLTIRRATDRSGLAVARALAPHLLHVHQRVAELVDPLSLVVTD